MRRGFGDLRAFSWLETLRPPGSPNYLRPQRFHGVRQVNGRGVIRQPYVFADIDILDHVVFP